MLKGWVFEKKCEKYASTKSDLGLFFYKEILKPISK